MSKPTQKEIKMFTNRLFNISFAIVLLSLIAIRSIGLAAFPHPEASGTFVTTSTTVHSAMEDKFNMIIDLSSTVTYTGTLEGTSTMQGTLTVYRDDSAKFKGVEVFTGLVNGIPGTLTFELEGNNDVYQAVQLTDAITSGTGALANLQGKFSKVGIVKDNGPIGTYTSQITNR